MDRAKVVMVGADHRWEAAMWELAGKARGRMVVAAVAMVQGIAEARQVGETSAVTLVGGAGLGAKVVASGAAALAVKEVAARVGEARARAWEPA